jgi:hypothetical protein
MANQPIRLFKARFLLENEIKDLCKELELIHCVDPFKSLMIYMIELVIGGRERKRYENTISVPFGPALEKKK